MSNDTVVDKNDLLYKLSCKSCKELAEQNNTTIDNKEKMPILRLLLIVSGIIIAAGLGKYNSKVK